MHNHESFNEGNVEAAEAFREGLEKVIKPGDLDVLKEDCPTDPENPLAKSAEKIDG